jgi:hypothetical protein
VTELATETSQESQEHILHSAASILRHDIQSFVINNGDNPNANEVSLAISVEKMWKGVKVCLDSETIDSVNPRIFLIVSIDTVYGSDAALYAFSSISQQPNLRSD